MESKLFRGEALTEDETKALEAYKALRLKKLQKKVKHEDQFHKRFEYLRSLSYLVDYRDFIRPGGISI